MDRTLITLTNSSVVVEGRHAAIAHKVAHLPDNWLVCNRLRRDTSTGNFEPDRTVTININHIVTINPH